MVPTQNKKPDDKKIEKQFKEVLKNSAGKRLPHGLVATVAGEPPLQKIKGNYMQGLAS